MGTLALYVDVYAADGATTVGFDHRGTLTPTAHFKAVKAGVYYLRVRGCRLNYYCGRDASASSA